MKVAALLLAVLLSSGAAAQSLLDCHFVSGWEQSGAMRQYAPDNLYEYKDGGAEGYLVYGFIRMTGIDCKSGANTIAIDVSEMTDADAAYGIFTANLDPAQPISQIGMGGQVQAQSASFAKGKYYVEIVEICGRLHERRLRHDARLRLCRGGAAAGPRHTARAVALVSSRQCCAHPHGA